MTTQMKDGIDFNTKKGQDLAQGFISVLQKSVSSLMRQSQQNAELARTSNQERDSAVSQLEAFKTQIVNIAEIANNFILLSWKFAKGCQLYDEKSVFNRQEKDSFNQMSHKFDELELTKKKGLLLYQSQLISHVLSYGALAEQCNLIKNIEAQMDIYRSKDYLLNEVMLSFSLAPPTPSEKPALMTKQKSAIPSKSAIATEPVPVYGLHPRQISLMK